MKTSWPASLQDLPVLASAALGLHVCVGEPRFCTWAPTLMDLRLHGTQPSPWLLTDGIVQPRRVSSIHIVLLPE